MLGVRETERAIKLTRELFEKKLCEKLNLERVSAPLFVLDGQGINDDLNGVERSVAFDIPALGKDVTAQIVHSLAKWKRLTLGEYKCFNVGDGIYTNMNAIRRDEELDNLHSVYVDQWDWERIIAKEDRNEKYLKETVQNIVDTVYEVSEELNKTYPVLKNKISKEITFITSEDLLQMYPGMTAKEREAAITKEKKTVFVMKIGDFGRHETRRTRSRLRRLGAQRRHSVLARRAGLPARTLLDGNKSQPRIPPRTTEKERTRRTGNALLSQEIIKRRIAVYDRRWDRSVQTLYVAFAKSAYRRSTRFRLAERYDEKMPRKRNVLPVRRTPFLKDE